MPTEEQNTEGSVGGCGGAHHAQELLQLKRLPSWLRRKPGSDSETRKTKELMRKSRLNTVCEEARCPNISECFAKSTATFMILGDICTRGCRFCSVHTGRPLMPATQFQHEAERVAEAAESLSLKHVVVTSVARDDLEDGGASGFVYSIVALRKRIPGVTIEVLIPDLRGNWDALREIIDAGPDVLNHNLETVPRLYRKVRPGASYTRSLELLVEAKSFAPKLNTKTGVMLGLGERKEEVITLLEDVKHHKIDIFTAGQYMQPTKNHLPVVDYLEPSYFDAIAEAAKEIGIPTVFCGPLVRSSYHAGEVFSQS